jgi:hypothetical protein
VSGVQRDFTYPRRGDALNQSSVSIASKWFASAEESAGATDEAAATAKPEGDNKTPSFADQVLASMKDESYEPPGDKLVEEKPPPKEVKSEEEGDEDYVPQTEGVPESEHEEEETEEEEEGQTVEAKKEKDEDEWSESAKVRVAQEKEKRITRTRERDEARAELQELKGQVETLQTQLRSATRPMLPNEPLSDVYDESSLRKAEAEYEDLLVFAEENRDGAFDVLVGKDAKGNEIRRDFSAKDIVKLRVTAERALRKDVPQRRQYLAARSQMDAEALKVYPQFKDRNSPWSQEASMLLQTVPELERVPDVLVWIGHALRGRDAFVKELEARKNGEPPEKVEADAKRIMSARRTPKAPSIPSDRGFSQRPGADNVEAAKQRLEKQGGDEAMEDYIGAVLARGRARRAHRPVA